jgi:hypothetical protein
MKPITVPRPRPGSPAPMVTVAALALLAGCAGRSAAPLDASSDIPPRVEPALPLYQQELEHEGWRVHVEVPASEDWASGGWRLRVWHSFLLVVPQESGAPRPGTPAGAWLAEMDGDPEPELALWSRPSDGQRPGHPAALGPA